MINIIIMITRTDLEEIRYAFSNENSIRVIKKLLIVMFMIIIYYIILIFLIYVNSYIHILNKKSK